MKKLSFKKILQKFYIIQKDRIIDIFYVDNIVFAFKKNKVNKVKKIIELLLQALTLNIISKLKWFLELYVIYNSTKQIIWLL